MTFCLWSCFWHNIFTWTWYEFQLCGINDAHILFVEHWIMWFPTSGSNLLLCFGCISHSHGQMDKASIVRDAIAYVQGLQEQVKKIQTDIVDLQCKRDGGNTQKVHKIVDAEKKKTQQEHQIISVCIHTFSVIFNEMLNFFPLRIYRNYWIIMNWISWHVRSKMLG